jgi:serine/threonine protein phosphatase PrpC
MEAIRSKLERSFQTTVVAAQVGPDRRTVRWLKVGDSRLVAFDAHGDVMADTDSSDTRGSQGRTDALPDHLDRLRSDGFELRAGGVVVLGSDGFFGGFENLAAVRDWALEPREDSLAGLHDRLRRSTGDDDISVVVVRVPA